jgi:hypothetical protein
MLFVDTRTYRNRAKTTKRMPKLWRPKANTVRLQWNTRFESRPKVCFIVIHQSPVGAGVAQSVRAGRPRSRSSSPGGVKNFLFSKSSRPALGPAQPPIQCVQGPLSPGVKRQGREADHSPPARAEVKKLWIHTSTPPYAFMAQCLIN